MESACSSCISFIDRYLFCHFATRFAMQNFNIQFRFYYLANQLTFRQPGLHDLRIACLNTYYNMKAISLHYSITDQLSD